MTATDESGTPGASQAGLDRVFAHIAANRESFIERVMDYVRHPSISAQNIGIAEVAALLVRMLRDLGLEAEAVPTVNHPMVLARWEKKPGAPTVLLYGHYDVQPPDPLDAWVSPPFEPTIRDGRIYARGIGDNKGQHFAQILAIEFASRGAWRTAVQRHFPAGGRGGNRQPPHCRFRARAPRQAEGRPRCHCRWTDPRFRLADCHVRGARRRLVRIASEGRQARPSFR